jgi:hypothetical protein
MTRVKRFGGIVVVINDEQAVIQVSTCRQGLPRFCRIKEIVVHWVGNQAKVGGGPGEESDVAHTSDSVAEIVG